MEGYRGKLTDGRDVFIPRWPVDVALENLGKVGKYLGVENVIRIADPNTAAALFSMTDSDDPKNTAGIIKHFVCTVRCDGDRITPESYDSLDIKLIPELFALVVHAQYFDFFESGLARENSPEL